MQKQIQRRHISRNCNPRTPGGFMHDEAVVIETQPQRQVPIPQVHLVLRVGGRLNIPALTRELELPLRAGIELTRIRDAVLQLLEHWVEYAVDSELPVLPALVARDICACISFA